MIHNIVYLSRTPTRPPRPSTACNSSVPSSTSRTCARRRRLFPSADMLVALAEPLRVCENFSSFLHILSFQKKKKKSDQPSFFLLHPHHPLTTLSLTPLQASPSAPTKRAGPKSPPNTFSISSRTPSPTPTPKASTPPTSSSSTSK